MQRLSRRIALSSSVLVGLLGLYACGGSGGGADAPAIIDTAEVGIDGPSGADGTTSDRDGATTDGKVGPGPDGSGGEAGGDAAGDAADDAAVDAPVDAGGPDAALPPAVRFVGRSDDTDPDHPKFGWPGARIIARFSGTDVNVTLNEQSLFSGPSRWDVLIDGSLSSTLVPNNGMGTYAIAVGLADAIHTIELYKRTEGQVGVTQFMGYDFPNAGFLLSPPPTPTHRIEFMGDSTTNGYGDECTLPTQFFSGATQNERLAYSGLTAYDLDADHHDTSFSGKGVLLNYTRSDMVVFDSLFLRTNPNTTLPAWAFAKFTPDVVWMTLGGNDWDQDPGPPAATQPNLTQFTNKYIALATLVRSKYADAHIFCAIAPSLNDGYPVGWNALTNMRTAMTNAVASRVGAGDTKIYAYEFSRADHDADLTGCGYHANLAFHRKMADEVIVQIKAKTGW